MAAKPLKYVLPLLLVLILASGGWLWWQSLATPLPRNAPTHAQVKIGQTPFKLELALDDHQRFQGLSERREIPADGGMLFVFPYAAPRAFVMRKCLVPIDILFLDGTGRIVEMHAMQLEPYDKPERNLRVYESGLPAVFAAELQGGMIAKLGVKKGDFVYLPVEELKNFAR